MPNSTVLEQLAKAGRETPGHTAAGSLPRFGGRRQRRQRRVPYRVPCRVSVLGEFQPISGQTANLSPGGVSVQVARDVQVGAVVEVLIPSIRGASMSVRGRVVHSRRLMTEAFELGVAITRDETPPVTGFYPS